MKKIKNIVPLMGLYYKTVPKPGITDNNAANLGLRFVITNLLSYHFVMDEES